MGGLQNNLIKRSKLVDGTALILLNKNSIEHFDDIKNYLVENQIQFNFEYELELLIRHGNYLSPVIVHGVKKDSSPLVLEGKSFEDGIIGMDLAFKIGASFGSKVQLISPAHVDTFFGDIPRSSVLYLDELIRTDVPEVDLFHLWVKLPFLQNLTHENVVNRIRIYTLDKKKLLKAKSDLGKFTNISEFKTWEERNQTLVWALNLESIVMVFLFMAMTLLVSLCITSGLLIFFDKIKIDLASFWILGTSKKNLEKSTTIFLAFMSMFAIIGGILLALLFLYHFDKYGVEVLPDIFVDRKIPISISLRGVLISFFVPTFISTFFSYFAIKQFKKEQSYLSHIRSVA